MTCEPLNPRYRDHPMYPGFYMGKCRICERRDLVRPLAVMFPQKCCPLCTRKVKEVAEGMNSPQDGEESRKKFAFTQLKYAAMSRRKTRRILSTNHEYRLQHFVDQLYEHIWPKK